MSQSGYLELLRHNRNYRRLWMGDIASLLGDWFNAIALYTLVRELTGSPLALGLVFLTKMLPFALASPMAGLLVDRFNRRRLMIGADLLRAVVVLGFLLVDKPSEVPLLYVLTALQMVLGAVFIPARSASIPNITSPRELLTANALSAATWSTLLALGAALGGVVTATLGVATVFVLDSLSYLISASFIARTKIPQATEPREITGERLVQRAFREIGDGWRHLRMHPAIARITTVKAVWALGGAGVVFMLILVGESLVPAAPSMGIGLVYGARGLGTGLGPVAARSWLRKKRLWPFWMGIFIAASGVTYLAVGALPWTLWIVVLVVFAHSFSGANWVLSTVLLQERTIDAFRGRVFATEWLMVTLVDSIAILSASLLLESELLTLRQGILLCAAIQILCGLGWLLLVVPQELRRDLEPAPVSAPVPTSPPLD